MLCVAAVITRVSSRLVNSIRSNHGVANFRCADLMIVPDSEVIGNDEIWYKQVVSRDGQILVASVGIKISAKVRRE